MTTTSPAHVRTTTRTTAHRGDSSRFRENTLPAIRSALAAGADLVEIDVRVTSDGAVVVLHDPTLDRLWGIRAEIAATTLAEVRALGDADHRPPLLSEVLELFAEGATATLLIDMEDASPAEAAYRVVEGTSARVAWCGHLDGMRTVRALDGAARIWMPWAGVRPPTVAELEALAPECVNMNVLTATREMVQEIHRLGCEVAVWTVDDEPTMRWATAIGVDAVTTNQLSRLQRVLADPAEAPEPGELDLDTAMDVARELAQWVIGFTSSSGPGLIATKTDPADLVTDIDVAVERHVREVIAWHFPDHGFVGEEMGGSAQSGVPCWYLDPVDGTTNLANSIPWNAFSLALVVDGAPVVAVVADPWRADLFEAVSGRGALLNGSPLRLGATRVAEGTDPLAGTVVSTELAAHVPWPGMIELLHELGDRYCTMRVMGSGTLSLVGVAAGRGAGAVIGSFGAVDHLAAVLVVHEAGGVVLGSTGEHTLFPSAGGIMAAAPGAAEALHAAWRSAVAAAS